MARILVVILLINWAMVYLFVNGQTGCTETGWFGQQCRYKCRCVDTSACDSSAGRCSDLACQPGWFGPSCQYADLAFGKTMSMLNGTGSVDDVTDDDDSTCAEVSSVQVDLGRKYLISWIRIISSNTSEWEEARVTVTDTSTNTQNECSTSSPGATVVLWADGGVVDVHCKEGVAGDTIRVDTEMRVDGNDSAPQSTVISVCALHVSGGRNVAIRGQTTQIGTRLPYVAALSVDSDTDQSVDSSSCSRTSDNQVTLGCPFLAMTADPWWQVVLTFEVKVVRFVVYARIGNEQLLTDLTLYLSVGGTSYRPLYQRPQDAAFPTILQLNLETPQILDRVALQVPGPCEILDFCELEMYGERVCPSGTYGLNCQGACGCRDLTEVCQPVTGGCASGCPDGFTGIACDQKCNNTRYGQDCSQICSEGCRDGICHHVTGECILGCEDGWRNQSKCDRKCEAGFWGADCSQPCPANCLDGKCNAIGLCERCQPGYKDFKCDHECGAGSFGQDCAQKCSFHCEVLDCDHVTGACACRAGWKPPQCLQPCDKTRWGPNCSESCAVGCVDQDCEPTDGKCLNGCGPGFLGDSCTETCGDGLFGVNCTQSCSAQCTNSKCNHIDGVCINCPSGFKGDFCDTPCEPGKWGSRCIQKCGPHCGGPDKGCSSTDGACSAGCDDGFTGAQCTQECDKGMYGQNCSQSCSEFCLSPRAGDSPCNHVTGYCPQGCRETHKGPACLTQVPTSTALVGGVVAGSVVAIVVVVALVVAFILIRRRKQSPKSMTPHTTEENGNVNLSSAYLNINHAYLHDGKEAYFEDEDEASDVGISMATGSDGEREKQVYYNTCAEISRTRMASRDLPSYLDKLRGDPVPLVEQFENLPKGLISTTSLALNVANKSKNRYKNICAYDHSRVKLNIIDGDPNSDYINASYVNGYDGQPKFIASQGPNIVIVNDFLRMLWERRVTTVVMLTNPIEAGKHKCEKYWPDAGEKKYGSVTVTLLSSRHTADYVVRTLQLAKEGRKIQVTQHHFTSWPDKGVPTSPWPLVDFHMVVSAHVASQPPEVPIVVHCSAGIGRTGTYIALDNLLSEAAATLSVDFNSCVWKLRQARVNMIQTAEQYMFLHEAVLVGLSVEGSLHKKDKLTDVVMELNKPTAEGFSKMAAEYKRLAMCQSKVDEDDYKAGRADENIAKNRYYNILPKDSHRPLLTPSSAGASDYINAVTLPGYHKNQQFVVTQMPLASTVLDLWKLVGEYPVSTIVVFPATPTTVGDTAPEFLPEEGQSCQFGAYKVTGRSHSQHDGYQEDFLFMVKAKRLSIRKNGRGVHVLRCEETNPGPDLILSIAQAAIFGLPEKQLEESLILAVCRTGAEMSGVFVTVAHLIQRLGEASVSVPTVVGHLRTVRPQLVSSLEQYQTIYEALKLFTVKSTVYTNVEILPPPKPLRKGGKERRASHNDHAKGSPEPKSSKADEKGRKTKKKEKGRSEANDGGATFNGSSGGATANGSVGGVPNGNAVNGSANSGGAAKKGTENAGYDGQGFDQVNGKGAVSFGL